MKVWFNRVEAGYGGGLAVVAANSAEEAHGTLAKVDSFLLEWYKFENWECSDNVTADTEIPYIIAEDHYVE